MPILYASARIEDLRCRLWSLKSEVAAQRVLRAGRTLARLLRKAGFNPGQPRDDRGRWSDGGGGDGALILVGANGRPAVSVRIGRGTLEATPGQAARYAIANARAQESARRVRELDTNWQPRPSLTNPNSAEGAIRRAEAEAQQAEARLAELSRARFGDNQGPPLDAPPRAGTETASMPPFEAIGSYRAITGMPDIRNGIAGRTSDGTVAFTEIDGVPVFGVNSDAPGYTASDEAMAREMRSRLIERHPDVMATGNIGEKPNDALFHAEANALMRAAEPYGGTLSGRTIELRVDRDLCPSCDAVLPSLGTQIGNPTVRILDGTGILWIMRDGVWIRRGRR